VCVPSARAESLLCSLGSILHTVHHFGCFSPSPLWFASVTRFFLPGFFQFLQSTRPPPPIHHTLQFFWFSLFAATYCFPDWFPWQSTLVVCTHRFCLFFGRVILQLSESRVPFWLDRHTLSFSKPRWRFWVLGTCSSSQRVCGRTKTSFCVFPLGPSPCSFFLDPGYEDLSFGHTTSAIDAPGPTSLRPFTCTVSVRSSPLWVSFCFSPVLLFGQYPFSSSACAGGCPLPTIFNTRFSFVPFHPTLCQVRTFFFLCPPHRSPTLQSGFSPPFAFTSGCHSVLGRALDSLPFFSLYLFC